MMKSVAEFYKVDFNRFYEDWKRVDAFSCPDDIEEARKIYDNIQLPKRATKGSAGYDFYVPYDIKIPYGTSRTFPTGIRCKIDEGWFLQMCPRSGQGFKYGIRFANTMGIIDSDYFYADNSGHIMAKIVNESVVNEEKKIFSVDKGSAFCQGIFLEYGVTYSDVTYIDSAAKRTGGFGSTGM